MLRIKEIRASKSNPAFMVVAYEQPVSTVEKLQGRNSKIKYSFAKADALKASGLKVGSWVEGSLKSVAHETAQYDGHKSFEATGKFYTTEFEQLGQDANATVVAKESLV